MGKVKIIGIFMSLVVGIGLSAEAHAYQGEDAAAGRTLKAVANNGGQTISDDRFHTLFNEFISDSLEKDPADLVLSRFKVNGNRPVSTGRLSFRMFQKSRGSLKGFVRLVAMVSVDGNLASEVDLSGWVDVFEDVVCTVRRMKKGETVTAEDVQMTKKNISRMQPHFLTDIDKVVGLTLKHDISESRCLKAWMLKKDPIVEKGDIVTILAALGGIKITAPGMILENGFSGDTIRVRNAMSKKKIYARVIDETTVVVDF